MSIRRNETRSISFRFIFFLCPILKSEQCQLIRFSSIPPIFNDLECNNCSINHADDSVYEYETTICDQKTHKLESEDELMKKFGNMEVNECKEARKMVS